MRSLTTFFKAGEAVINANAQIMLIGSLKDKTAGSL